MALTDRIIQDVRRVLRTEGPAGLQVGDLSREDLRHLGWSGSSTHLANISRALDRVESGEVEYLVVRAPGGEPIAKGGIDYAEKPGVGTLWQLATVDELQSLGIGTHLITVAEQRMRKRGLYTAELAVEDNNRRAMVLYERLGYRKAGRKSASWNREDPAGNVTLYETELAVLRKDLARFQADAEP